MIHHALIAALAIGLGACSGVVFARLSVPIVPLVPFVCAGALLAASGFLIWNLDPGLSPAWFVPLVAARAVEALYGAVRWRAFLPMTFGALVVGELLRPKYLRELHQTAARARSAGQTGRMASNASGNQSESAQTWDEVDSGQSDDIENSLTGQGTSDREMVKDTDRDEAVEDRHREEKSSGS